MDASEEYTFAELLRQFRVREGLSQQRLADNLEMHRNTVGAWERGDYLPETTEMISKIAEALSLNAADEQRLLESTHERIALRIIWNVPHQRNPLFTGREAVLTQLHTQLHKQQTVVLTQTQAIHGLGGIGKTQTAVEYAYRYRNDYQATLWVQADTQDALIRGFVSLAILLRLPERDEQQQQRVVNAVKQWLSEHTQWLLILDNVEDMRVVKTFLPATYSGHVLLTTRSQALGGMTQGIMLGQMEPREGALFLLRRATIIRFDGFLDLVDATELADATAIVGELGGLPLALDQAGAYIEETQCGLSQYLQRYQTRRAILLQRRGKSVTYYPESVATTWAISFEKVEQQNPAAADLLRLCAFLSPDAIPEEIITKGGTHLGQHLSLVASDPLLLDEAIAALGAYSLIHRDARVKVLSIHRLVQAVLKEAMEEKTQQWWAERTVRAVNEALPKGDFIMWQQCEQCLPHAQVCALLIKERRITFSEAAQLLHWAGTYLLERANTREAGPFLQQALALREHHLGPEHPNTANTVDRLARFYKDQGKYEEAEPLYQRALTIWEQQLGPTHPSTAMGLNNLALLYYEQGKYAEAEPLYQRALTTREQQLGPSHLATAMSLNNLALLYYEQRKYTQAEPLYQRALSIREQHLGPLHPSTADSFNNLAMLYYEQGKYAEAESLYQRALTIREQHFGPTHPTTAESFNNLATIYREQGKYAKAEQLLQRALTIWEQQLGPTHPTTGTVLHNLATIYREQGKYAEAEPLYQRALTTREQQFGPSHLATAMSLNNLALLYYEQRKYAEAEPLYQRALAIFEQQLEPHHTHKRAIRKHYALLLRAMGREEEAIQEETRDQDTAAPS